MEPVFFNGTGRTPLQGPVFYKKREQPCPPFHHYDLTINRSAFAAYTLLEAHPYKHAVLSSLPLNAHPQYFHNK